MRHEGKQRDTSITVREVPGERPLKAFLQVPARVFRDDPLWVRPLDLERKDHLNPAKNPYFENAEVAFWVAERDGEPIGRVSAQVNRVHEARYGDLTGHFGFLDGIDDPNVFAALTVTAESWLRAKGMRRAVGPFSLSINDESGLLVKGFDTPPSMMMGHAKPYYGQRLEACGYRKAKDLIAYKYGQDLEVPRVMEKMIARAKKAGRVTTRHLNMARYREDLLEIMDIFNDAWSENWGFLPFSKADVGYLAKAIRPLIASELVVIAEVDGEPAAMVVILPNLNEAIAGLDGKLLPLGWAKLLWRLKVAGVRTARMPLMGVRKKHQASNMGGLLAVMVITEVRANAKAKGFTSGELSWVLEDNMPTRHIIENMGADPYKTYRIYEKDLA